MAPLPITLRKRTFLKCAAGLYNEHTHEWLGLVMNILQFYACFGFYPGVTLQFYNTACSIFFVASFITFCQSIGSTWECVKNALHTKKKHAALPPNTPTEAKLVLLMEAGAHEREQIEAVHFFFGGAIFAAGSILYLPNVYEHSARNDLNAGTACFVIGSLLFGTGSFVNGLGLKFTATIRELPRDQLFAAAALWNNLSGAVLYFAGSFFYFPETEAECKMVGVSPACLVNVTCTAESEWNLVTLGTHLYVAGGACYVAGSMCSCALTYVKHKEPPVVPVGVSVS